MRRHRQVKKIVRLFACRLQFEDAAYFFYGVLVRPCTTGRPKITAVMLIVYLGIIFDSTRRGVVTRPAPSRTASPPRPEAPFRDAPRRFSRRPRPRTRRAARAASRRSRLAKRNAKRRRRRDSARAEPSWRRRRASTRAPADRGSARRRGTSGTPAAWSWEDRCLAYEARGHSPGPPPRASCYPRGAERRRSAKSIPARASSTRRRPGGSARRAPSPRW